MTGADFTEKTVIITGAGRGIGAQVARAFFKLGASVAICDRNPDHIASLTSELSNGGMDSRVLGEVFDVTDSDACGAFVSNAVARFGQIDVLVNNAGIVKEHNLVDLDRDTWDELIAVNLTSVFTFCHAVLKHLAEDSAILNISSLAGHEGAPGFSAYSATKAGVLGFSRSLVRELAPRTRVNCISPAEIDTPMHRDMVEQSSAEALLVNPLGRLGTTDDVAALITFLCSSQAKFITGETVHINGGMYISG